MPRWFDPSLLLATAAWAIAAGCSQGPTAIRPPSIDADSAGDRALQIYDKDGDSFVAGQELDSAPSLKASMARLDANNDGKVSAEEIATRIRVWQTSRIGMTTLKCTVKMDGKPLGGATVALDPAPFLGDAVQQAVGKTEDDGMASPIVPKEKRQADTPPGLALGFYDVRISKTDGKVEKIPDRYNKQTTLGIEVTMDNSDIINRRVLFDLKSSPTLR